MEQNDLLAQINSSMLDAKGKCFSLMDQMYNLAVTPQVAYIQGLMKIVTELKKENERLKAELEIAKSKTTKTPPRQRKPKAKTK